MNVKRISKEEARELFDRFLSNDTIDTNLFNDLDAFYSAMRKDLLSLIPKRPNTGGYGEDLFFAKNIYEYFRRIHNFDEKLAEDYDFWRYICIKVAPEIIALRHAKDQKYYFEQPNRMYFPVMWWYMHMSYQGSIEKTLQVLNDLSTDYIMQLVDRKGRYGFYLEVSREIMRCISLVPKNIRNHKESDKILFRRVMIQNTAICDNYNLTVENSTKEYVYKLFKACKVEVEKYEDNIGRD